MKITVITVTFNSAETVIGTLRSVASQSYPNVEHIVVDGGSTDGTLEHIRRHGSGVKRVVSEPDNGIYDAMNKGLRLASGDFVGFLNGDDTFAGPGVLADVAAAASQPAVDAIYGDLVYVSKNHPDRVVRYWRSGSWSCRQLALGWMAPHPTLYMRKALVDQYGAFDERLDIAADYDFMLRYFRRPDINVVYIRKVLVCMRTGGASNRSFGALYRKSREDLLALKRNAVGGWLTLLCKIARKLPQFMPAYLRPKH